MQNDDEKPKPDTKPDPLADTKATAPTQMPGVMSAREWAMKNGIWSSGGPPGMPRKFPYSITE